MTAAAGDILLLMAQPKSRQNMNELWSARVKKSQYGQGSPKIACRESCSPPKKKAARPRFKNGSKCEIVEMLRRRSGGRGRS